MSHYGQSFILSKTIEYADEMTIPQTYEAKTGRSHQQDDKQFRNTFTKKPQTSCSYKHRDYFNRTIQSEKRSSQSEWRKQRLSLGEHKSIIMNEKRPQSHMVRSLKKDLNKAGVSGQTQLFDAYFQQTFDRFSRMNFKRVAQKKIPLSFLKPQGKYSIGKSMQEVKSNLYQQLDRVPDYRVPKGQLIQYVTDYKQPHRKTTSQYQKIAYKPKKCQNPSFLRQRLKSKIKDQNIKNYPSILTSSFTLPNKKSNIVSI